ncbi:MAG TPA: diaminopimelate epimerase [Phycisphaerae bacterium]|nr:diaminopimelate epimerase [Phycisphaerae bacterium]
MRFIKMHGIGNDYVYVDTFSQKIDQPEQLAVKVADRHFGIGGDGLILVAPPTDAAKSAGATVRMRMFNADGSESEMCGNGVRCVAKFAYDHNLSRQNPMKIETGRGVLSLQLHTDPHRQDKIQSVTVNMGPPILDLEKIPVDPQWLGATSHPRIFQVPMGTTLGVQATFVSMGNPHAVIYVEDVAKVDLEKIGPVLENHKAFPRRINVHFVQVHSRGEITMRTWERGSGITLACGTGAAAVCVAGVLTHKTDPKILAHLPGGDLTLEWKEATTGGDDSVYMTGTATEVFTGEWPEQ